MSKFIPGKKYRFKQPTYEDIIFYEDPDSAYLQDGTNGYFPVNGEAVVEFLGTEEIGGEDYLKWRHDYNTVYINFADDDCFTEI